MWENIDISLWENTVCMQFAKITRLEVDHDTLVLKVLEFNHLWHQKLNPTHWQKNEVLKTVISREKHIKHIKHLYTAPNWFGTTVLQGLIRKNCVDTPGNPPEVFNMCPEHGAETVRMHNKSATSVERTAPMPHLFTKLYARPFSSTNRKIVWKRICSEPHFSRPKRCCRKT